MVGYFLGIVWCLIFGGFGLFLIKQRKKYSNYKTFSAKVESIETINGRHTAVIQSGIQKIGLFNIKFQDLGDYQEGQRVDCMWDGYQPKTAQEDLRNNQKIGIIFCFSAVVLMLVILTVYSIL
ncbi:MAG: hypothetical protein V2J55_15400 [Candidatus Competibacteraceae bacterium]|jgi:hypothetical protein|nr:hypothetical protein [Candidatus Competibacteraceae bacterium]